MTFFPTPSPSGSLQTLKLLWIKSEAQPEIKRQDRDATAECLESGGGAAPRMRRWPGGQGSTSAPEGALGGGVGRARGKFEIIWLAGRGCSRGDGGSCLKARGSGSHSASTFQDSPTSYPFRICRIAAFSPPHSPPPSLPPWEAFPCVVKSVRAPQPRPFSPPGIQTAPHPLPNSGHVRQRKTRHRLYKAMPCRFFYNYGYPALLFPCKAGVSKAI